MRIFDYQDIWCQTCNHMYFALQCFIEQRRTGVQTGYLTTRRNADHIDLENKFRLYNIDTNCIRYDVGSDDSLVQNTSEGLSRYKQVVGTDFTIGELEDFVRNTFMESGKFIGNDKDNVVALHIRNKDYLSPMFCCFDRVEYLKKALDSLDESIDTMEVFSDDINFTQKNYDGIIRSRIKTVNYNCGTKDTDDFIKFACIRNKILWNSTFSYWAAFVGNVLYPDSYNNVITQVRTVQGHPDRITMNPEWRFVR